MSQQSILWCAVSALLLAAAPVIGSTLPVTGTYQGTYSVLGMSGSDFLFNSQQSATDSSLGLSSLAARWAVTLGTPNLVHDGSATFSRSNGDRLFGTFSGDSVQIANDQRGTLALIFTGGTGLFSGASGTAEIAARLTDSGVAAGTLTGTISGAVQLAPEPSALSSLLLASGLFCGVELFRNSARGRLTNSYQCPLASR